jgi:ribonuclease HII
MASGPTFAAESALWSHGIDFIAGVDEVGRGPLAGPVAAGAVILPPRIRASGRFKWLGRVNDSKQLTPEARDELAHCIWEHSLAAAVGFISVTVLDQIGIAEASRQAMFIAIGELSQRPQHLLLDAFPLRACSLPQTPIIKGDALSRSIACASIIAKVARDRVMDQQELMHPGYGFFSNKGYYTPEHVEALHSLGPCALHRRSFAPVRDMVRALDSLADAYPVPTHPATLEPELTALPYQPLLAASPAV